MKQHVDHVPLRPSGTDKHRQAPASVEIYKQSILISVLLSMRRSSIVHQRYIFMGTNGRDNTIPDIQYKGMKMEKNLLLLWTVSQFSI